MNFDNRWAGDDARADDEMMTGTDEKVVNFAEARQAKRSRAEQAADKATEKADEARRRAEEEAAERAEQVAALRAHMLAFLIDNDVHYCGATDCWWLWTERDRSWLPLKERAVRMLLPGVLFDREGWGMFTGVMEDEGRNHRRITSSFKPQPDGVLNMMRPNFCPVADRADYHPFFDTLMTSLSDGDEAAKAHIEKLILSKHQHPDNHLLPALCIHNEDGGAGKNLFVSGLLTTVFGKEMVTESLTMDDLSGRFNDHLTGKAVWFIDEAVEDKADHNTVKRLLGAEHLWIEPKLEFARAVTLAS